MQPIHRNRKDPNQLESTSKQRRTILQVVNDLGVRGLYRGTLSTLCRDVPFSILFFQSFASLKNSIRDPYNSGPQLGKTLVAGIIAGAVSAFSATPMDGKTYRPKKDQSIILILHLSW